MATFADLKKIHDEHLDPKKVVECYTSKESEFEKDSIKSLLGSLTKAFPAAGVEGKTMIMLSVAPFLQYLLPVCESFTEIIIGGSTDKCISEIEKWKTNAPGAIDFSYAAKAMCELQGNRDAWSGKLDMLRGKIKQVLIYDFFNCNPFFPIVVTPADCLFLKHSLECQATNKEEFRTCLKNASPLLKKGGHLILMACLEQTYYVVDGFKFPNLSVNKDFVIKVLDEGGYAIKESEVLPRRVFKLYDLADYTSVLYIRALKK
ncbi:nicotinamide N-methyltransferase-like [Lissotriton helveticus]